MYDAYYDADADALADAREEARADAHYDAQHDLIQDELDTLVQPIMDRVEEIDPDENYPRPLTRDQDYAMIWDQEGEDALRELLEEEHREEAEDAARDNYDEGPCCNEFSCPCGNSNNFRGF